MRHCESFARTDFQLPAAGHVALPLVAMCVIAIATGCSRSNDSTDAGPDYRALRRDLEESLSTVSGWSWLDTMPSHEWSRNVHERHSECVVHREYTSVATGEEVGLRIFAGKSRYVHACFTPSPTMTGNSHFHDVEIVRNSTAKYPFRACRTTLLEANKSHAVLCTHAFHGQWRPYAVRAVFSPPDSHGLFVEFWLPVGENWKKGGELPGKAKQLIAEVMDRITPVVFASEFVTDDPLKND
jgi:hypothetical protein